MIQEEKYNIFITEVVKYFRDFLETNFHKRQIPKRNIRYKDEKNFLLGLKLIKYKKFHEALINIIVDNTFKNQALKVKLNKYKTVIPYNLLDLINKKIDTIKESKVNQLINQIENQVYEATKLYHKNVDSALTFSIDKTQDLFTEIIINPLLDSIEEPILTQSSVNVEPVYIWKENLIDIFTESIREFISESINMIFVDNRKIDKNEFTSIWNLDYFKNTLKDYFKNIAIDDLVYEIREVYDNNKIFDKKEIYLYFCDIEFQNNKYPIFYIPITIEKYTLGFEIRFDTSLYINKKAINYITEKYNEVKNLNGQIRSIDDRILYTQEINENLTDTISGILIEICDYFSLDAHINVQDSSIQKSRGKLVKVTNNTHICIFDKSDEALINDYEEMLQLLASDNSILSDKFNDLITNFISHEPLVNINEINDTWDDTKLCDQLIDLCPVPLNEEQRKISLALENPNTKYITVEGPPGTGKSHTITALIFKTIQKNQSVLVLSDKKEALDVVENKITEVMNNLRPDKNFQNPILRLGKTGNTYNSILSAASISMIRGNYHAVKKNKSQWKSDLKQIETSLKDNIMSNASIMESINLQDLYNYGLIQRNYISQDKFPIDVDEIGESKESIDDFKNLNKTVSSLTKFIKINYDLLFQMINSYFNNQVNHNVLTYILTSLDVIKNAIKDYPTIINSLSLFDDFNNEYLEKISKYVRNFNEIQSGIFGTLFRRKDVKKLNADFVKDIKYNSIKPPIKKLLQITEVQTYFTAVKNSMEENSYVKNIQIDLSNFTFQLLTTYYNNISNINSIEVLNDINQIDSFSDLYPKSSHLLNINTNEIETYWKNKLCDMDDTFFGVIIEHLERHFKITSAYDSLPNYDFVQNKTAVEQLVTHEMTQIMDGRLINFIDKHKATAQTLKINIRKKKRFPRIEFNKLKFAFPCIIAGIRDYAEYIPLESDIFDLLIIDEASQVSIAQAFPALLRAKKVIVLGDKKQFSNVKAALARTKTNKEYVNRLRQSFVDVVSSNPSQIERLSKFNIKTSILDFFAFVSNYNILLRKHFRGYQEHISYSNKYFYSGYLQAIKLRNKPIDDIIKFTYLEPEINTLPYRNVNLNEIHYIISELNRIKDSNIKCTVGIITPHTNQQKLLSSEISQLPDRDYYYDTLKLKVMTFDTCQGEERDIIYYSMVANKYDDKLWGVFIKDLHTQDLEEGGIIKAQRLNVGFSRVKEQMHFVLSKNENEFKGSIGEALRHYKSVLDSAKLLPEKSDVDPKSPMEVKVIDWIKNTEIYANNIEDIEVQAQFPIGKYLKQIDPLYDHPNFVVDFLLMYKSNGSISHNIIIEYDGFLEHFDNYSDVNEYNYDQYYSAEHVSREKILESYGYRFVRLNRFNTRKDPIQYLNNKLTDIIRNKSAINHILRGKKEIIKTMSAIKSGKEKLCPKCNQLRPISAFKDSSLISGQGRICNECKSEKYESCPRCGAPLKLRYGSYGSFYGCSQYPKCKYTSY